MARRCRHCPAEVELLTLSSGLTLLVDPAPIDPLGELAATLDGRPTATVYANGAAHTRTPATIEGRPAGTAPRRTEHAAHRCGSGRPGTGNP